MLAMKKLFAVIFLLLAVYCALDPYHHSLLRQFTNFEAVMVVPPESYKVPVARDTGNILHKAKVSLLDGIQGPASIAFDPSGRGMYTGLADGRIVFWNGEKWSNFANTSANRSDLCDVKSSLMSYLENEHICGRPLGLKFHKRTGDLYIADAYFGLMMVGPQGGVATSLVTEAEGVPLGFTNDLDVDDQGNVYFIDSSTKYQRRNFLELFFSGEASGRVLKYNAKTKETTVLLRDLQFPTSISLSTDDSYFVFTEVSIRRLSKYWLKGENSGTTKVMAALRGFPDSVRNNNNDKFWVATYCCRTPYSDLLAVFPIFRKFVFKLPIPAPVHYALYFGGHIGSMIVKYDSDGTILNLLEDWDGRVVRASEVEERDGKLWIGSLCMSSVAVYKLDDIDACMVSSLNFKDSAPFLRSYPPLMHGWLRL